jgi:hypothetical protein
MSALLLAVALAAADDKPDLDGKWLIVYAEESGKRNTTWEQAVATVKGDMLSYEKTGEKRALKLTFGPDQTVKATVPPGARDVVAKPLTGVAIVGQDYLCLSLNADGKKPEKGSSGSLILILRRQR